MRFSFKNQGTVRTIFGAAFLFMAPVVANAASMGDYCVQPAFIAATVPPQVLFSMGKDHKYYFPAFNDASDVDGDGKLDTTYDHSITYYGYFDPYKCYTYMTSGGEANTFIATGDTYDPVNQSVDAKYCTGTNAGKWSGNFLNWLTMSRADIIKRVLYGGYRTTDNSSSTSAVISGENIPQDGHSWAKEYVGSDATKLFPGAVTNNRALFCVTSNGASSKPVSQLRVIPDVTAVTGVTVSGGLRAWHWVNVEGNGNICSVSAIDKNGDGVADSHASLVPTSQRFDINVKACGDLLGYELASGKCAAYGSNYKPVGVLQSYGERKAPGAGKVCSKDMATPCSSNSQCSSINKGACIDQVNMYFGLMTGSFKNPKAGGVLRKNIWSFLNEVNSSAGNFQTSNTDQKGLIIQSIESMKCPTTYPISQRWGNPTGEILYEGLRYLKGLQSPTPQYVAGISDGSDDGLSLTMPAWDAPEAIFPICSQRFILHLSDIYNSFDTDQIPGTAFSSFSNSAGNLPNFDLGALADRIFVNENKPSTSITAMVGQSGTTAGANTDGTCSEKTLTGFASVRGICPSEPDLEGGYSPAAVALYGHNNMNVATFAVGFNSLVPEITVKTLSGSFATIVPYGKSVSTDSSLGWSCSTANFTFAVDASANGKGVVITPKNTTGKCPTLQMVRTYVVDTPLYHSGTSDLKYIKFKSSFDDVGGGDFDMDVLADYTICAGSINTSDPLYTSGKCPSLSSDQVSIKVERVYSQAGNAAAFGFTVAGAGSANGTYLIAEHTGSNRPWGAGISTTSATRIFTASGESGKLPENPLMLAAKYGGFKDSDGDGLPYMDATCGTANPNPRCAEWDEKGDGLPDTYFPVNNPNEMERKLKEAFDAILARTASGTAASILSNSEGSGANILQAIFFPKKIYENQTEISWSGEMYNLWYYIDPRISGSTIREDDDYVPASSPPPDNDHVLNIGTANVIKLAFNSAANQTLMTRIRPDGSQETVSPDDPEFGLKSIWSAGKLLWGRSAASRKIYTQLAGTLVDFTALTTASASTQQYLQASSQAEANTIISFVKGDEPAGYRKRSVTIGGATNVWKLGDIVSSTPRLQSTQPIGSYQLSSPLGYDDLTYKSFTETTGYQNRGMVYAGANDGMLHAFKLGKLTVKGPGITGNIKATLSGNKLGEEQWTFIPRNVLPYLKYLGDVNYKENNHIYYVDGTTQIFDVSTGIPAGCTESNYWQCPKASDGSSWRTYLVGGMGIGGASRKLGDAACTDKTAAGTCVKTPILDPADNTKGLGFSSYYSLDVTGQYFGTDPNTNTLQNQPSLKWEFNSPQLGFTTTGPAIVRLNARTYDAAKGKYVSDRTKNGRWLVVFGSGPTGPIDTTLRQFKGKSDQNLRLFVYDLERGPTAGNYWVIDTGITEAFAGSLNSAVVDTDRPNKNADGYYQDDALYVGYVQKASDGSWTNGGVLRVIIPDSVSPDDVGFNPSTQWKVSKVIDGIGPVTSSVAKLQGKNLYLFFGTGRYFFNGDDANATTRRLFMVKEPCYKATVIHDDNTKTVFDIDDSSSSTCAAAPLTLSDLTDRTAGTANESVDKGWYITLDQGERVITDPVATVNGSIFYTTFVPEPDICKFGGTSYLWAVKFDSGYQLDESAKVGKVLIQASTGGFEEVDLATAMAGTNSKQGRRMNEGIIGKPASDAPPIISKAGLKPVKKILHIKER